MYGDDKNLVVFCVVSDCFLIELIKLLFEITIVNKRRSFTLWSLSVRRKTILYYFDCTDNFFLKTITSKSCRSHAHCGIKWRTLVHSVTKYTIIGSSCCFINSSFIFILSLTLASATGFPRDEKRLFVLVLSFPTFRMFPKLKSVFKKSLHWTTCFTIIAVTVVVVDIFTDVFSI